MKNSCILKRVGKSADGQYSTLKLMKYVTRIGRHTENDYCLDSTKLPCLISRWHSAITREEVEGSVQYFVYDCNSINGTFLNSKRIPGHLKFRLKEGDVITFGCLGGNDIKEGERVTEELSEFQYIFTKASELEKGDEDVNMPVKAGQQLMSVKDPPFDVIKIENGVEHLVSANIPFVNGVKMKNGSSLIVSASVASLNGVKVKEEQDHYVVAKLPLPGVIKVENEVDNLLSSKVPFSGVIKVETEKKNISGQPLSLPESSFCGNKSSHTKDQAIVVNGSSDDTRLPSSLDCNLPLKKTLNNSTGHLPPRSSEQISPCLSNESSKKKRKNTVNSAAKCTGSSNSSENVSKRRKAEADKDISSTQSSGQKKAKTQNTKKRRSRKTLNYSDDELCSAFNCQRPDAETVSWVQCDDCDQWFHIECVTSEDAQCDIKQLQQSEFHCGCV